MHLHHALARRLAPALLCVALTSGAVAAARADIADRIALPAGFRIAVWAEVPGAREMAVAPDLGVVFVSDEADSVHVVRPAAAGRATAGPLLSGLHAPSGVAYRDGWLYVAERTRVLRYRARDLLDGAKPAPQVVATGLPDKSHHGTRILALDARGRVYVSVGTPCNLCEPRGIEGTILRYGPEGGRREVFASGIRNSVGIAFEPSTGDAYFTDNGVDRMGDDSPPEELNRAPTAGLFFGYPDYGGGHDRPPGWKPVATNRDARFPALTFPAHVAPLGLAFYTGDQFPPDYRGDLFVAQHGSWNRSVPQGYQVVRVRFADGQLVKAEPFALGWLTKDYEVLGRPADVKQAADGSLLVSDDHRGVIYRIRYGQD